MKLSFHKLEDLQTGRPRWAPVFPACNNHAARIHVVLLTARGIRSSQHHRSHGRVSTSHHQWLKTGPNNPLGSSEKNAKDLGEKLRSHQIYRMVAPNCHKISLNFWVRGSDGQWQNCLAAWPSKSNHFHQFPGNDLAGSAGI